MSLSTTVNYDTPSELNFDSNKIEIVSGKAQLKLAFSAAEDFSEDFADDTGFTYDSSKAEFSGGQVQSKDQTPGNSRFGVSYSGDANPVTTEADLNWHKTGGATSAILNGSPTIVSGKLVCSGSQGVSYAYTSATRESHKFLYTPDYTAAPPSNVNILSTHNGTNNNDRFNLTNSPSGNNLRLTLYNSTGSVVISIATTLAGWSPLAGTEYEFEVVLDSVAGTVRVFVNGVLLGTNSPGPWTRGVATNRAQIGASSSVYNQAAGSFDDYIVFDNAQHTASYTPGYTIPALIYAEALVILPTFTYSGPGLLRAAGPPSSTEAGSPRYVIQGKYWDGSEWSDSSDTYATASSKADILANIATFPSTGVSQIIVEVIFPDSNVLSSVDQIDFSVQGEFYPTDNPSISVIERKSADALEAFSAVAAATGSDSVAYILKRSESMPGPETLLYWDGSAWSVSDGTLAQSNTASEINANAASLDLGESSNTGYYIRFCVLLHSDDGNTTPSVTSTTFTYSFFTSESSPAKCIVYGWLKEVDGTPLEGEVRFSNREAYHHSGNLIPRGRVVVNANTDTGYWEAEIIETETVTKTVDVRIRYKDPIKDEVRYTAVTIPNQASASLESLLP